MNNDKEINYLKIVLDGWVNPNNRNSLLNYFKREMQLAERDFFYQNIDFLNGCFRIVKGFDQEMETRLLERKNELYLMIDLANSKKTDILEIKDQNGFINKIDKAKHIKELDYEAEKITKRNYPINLHHYDRNYFGSLNYDDLKYIEISLLLIENEIEKDKSKIRLSEITEIIKPKYILELNEVQISKSYEFFVKHLHTPILSYKEYIDCFDEMQTPKYPKFNKGQNKNFVYFFCEAGANEKIAVERFGIKSFATTKNRNEKINPPAREIVKEIKQILNR